MAEPETFESLLQAVRAAWMRGCQASAREYLASQAVRAAESNEGTAVPRRMIVKPPERAMSAHHPPLEIDVAELSPRRWMKPASLSVSFDCELRQKPDQLWQLFIVHPDSKPWWGSRPRHRVEIEINGQRDGGGVVRFDGHLWRKVGGETR